MELHETMRIRPLLLLVVVACLAGCSGEKPEAAKTPRIVTASTQPAKLREVVECRSFPAQVESEQSVTLASKVAGTVESVSAREGDMLRAGQPIMPTRNSSKIGRASCRERV